jgi:hypothetical protein
LTSRLAVAAHCPLSFTKICNFISLNAARSGYYLHCMGRSFEHYNRQATNHCNLKIGCQPCPLPQFLDFSSTVLYLQHQANDHKHLPIYLAYQSKRAKFCKSPHHIISYDSYCAHASRERALGSSSGVMRSGTCISASES